MSVSTPVITHANAKIEQEFNQLLIGRELIAYKIRHRVRFTPNGLPKNFRRIFSPIIKQGLVRPKLLRQYLRDRTTELECLPQLSLVPSSFAHVAAQEGLSVAQARFAKRTAAATRRVYDLLANGKTHSEQIVQIDTERQLLFDQHGDIMPTAILCGEHQGNFRDGAYHLERLVKVLSKDPRVAGVKGALRIRPVAPKDRRPGNERTVSFIVKPSAQDMRRLWTKMRALDRQYPATMLYQALFDLDLLGLRRAGATKYSTYLAAELFGKQPK
jgi:hypothetical protein